MKWFAKKSIGRGFARPALTRMFSGAATGEWPRSYEAQLRDAYMANPVAQRAVKLITQSAGGAALSGEDRLVALVSAHGLMERIAGHLLLHGNSYVQILRDADGHPAELFALRPERVSIEADAAGWPGAYLYRVGDGVTRFAPDEIVHVKAFHPADDHYGLGCLGCLGVAAGAVATHNAATRWNKALLDNAARPSGALVCDGTDNALSPEQFDRLRAELEASFSGAGNAGRPMLLEGGLKWQTMSLTPADMDFIGLKAAAAREIALAFGVPPMLLGLPGDAAYANYREANRALWRLAVLPLMGTILDAISKGIAGWVPDAALTVDLDRVPALAEDRERLWRQVSGADFLTADEKRKVLGL